MKVLELKPIQTARHGEVIDFVISGRAMHEELWRRGYDLVPRTGTRLVPTDTTLRSLLMRAAPGDSLRGRIILYVCPLCGSLGCGAVTVQVAKDHDTYSWADFAYETDYVEEGMDGFHTLERLGPFRFDAGQYAAALSRVLDDR